MLYTFAAVASNTGCNFAKACFEPDAITVISPFNAFAAPPETGASNIIKPNSVNFCEIACASCAAIVEDTITAVPAFNFLAMPFSLNNTAFACAALTTKITTASNS